MNKSDKNLRIRKSSHISNDRWKPKDKIYKALGNLNLAIKHWNQFLLAELDLKATISEFQNVDFNSTSKNKKQLLRQGYQLKRELIQYINNQDYEVIKQKLDILSTMSINQKERQMIQTFKSLLHLKQLILNKKPVAPYISLYRKQTYNILKQNAKKWSQIQDKTNSIVVKIFSIMALHFIKLSGVIMSDQQHSFCIQALELKKKQFMVLQDQSSKVVALQSLLFTTFEYYKIIKLLKKDQHQILFYYNNIVTCVNIFKTKFKGFEVFQRNFDIQAQIEKIQPLYLNVDIYEDSKRRRILSYQNRQDQMLNNRKSLPSRLLISFKQKAKVQVSSNQHKQIRNSLKIQKRISTLDHISLNTLVEQAVQQVVSTKQHIQNLINPENFDTQQFSFDFCLIHSNKLIIGSFKVNFNRIQKCLINVDVSLKLKDEFFYLLVYEVKGLSISVEQLKYSFLSRNLWKAVKYILSVQQQIYIEIPGFQNFATAYLPKNINQKEELPALTQIYQTLLMKFRRTKMCFLITGHHLSIQRIPVSNIAKFLQNLVEKQQKQIFKKRLGFINQEILPFTLLNQKIKRLIFLDYEKQFNYIQLIFNGEDLKQVLFTQKNYQINSKKLIEEMKKISKIKYTKKGRNFTKKLISIVNQRLIILLHEIRYVYESTGNIQLELQVMNKQTLPTYDDGIIFKDHWINKKKYLRRKEKSSFYVPLHFADRLQILQKKEYKFCEKYFNQKVQLITDKRHQINTKIQGIETKHIRLQMYKTIINFRKISNVVHCWRLFLSRNNQDSQPKKLHQEIYVEFLQHRIVKINRIYYILLQYYFFRNKSFVYQVVLTQNAQKFANEFLNRIQQIEFDPINLILNGKTLKQVKKRGKLSDINCFIEQKINEHRIIKRKITL